MSAAQALSDGVIVDNEAWLPLITEWPKRSIAYFSDGYPDPVSLSHGSLAFQLGDDFDNQHWSRYDWDGALLEIYIGESGTSLSQYRQIFAGTAGPIERDGNIAKVALRGPEAALETNILTNEYLGTGGAEGDANLTGNVKPKAFGKCFNIAPVLIDSAYQIYQFHDGAAAAVHGVYENGYPIAGSAKATVTTYSALANLTLTVGEYAIAPAAGMIRLGGQPRGKVTADITGANGTTIASIVKALLTQFGAVYNATSLNAWNQEWNLYLTDQMSVGDAVRSAFDGQGFLFPDSLGRFRACNFYGTAKTPITLRDDRSSLPLVNSVKQLPSASPAYGVRVGHTRTWAVHSASEISEAIRDAGIETANAKEAARLAQEAADEAKADAAALKVRIDDFAEDGKLSSAEKLIIIQRMAEFNTERPSMEADADRYSITTAKTNYQSKLDALNTYLASLSPAWDDVAVSTPIVRNTFKAKFTDFTTARVSLLGEFADAASSITGSLTNDSHVVIADSAGNVADFSDANGVFTVMKGIADVTSAATFTKVSQTNCTATIGPDGYYSVTAMSANSANVKLRASYDGVSVDKTFTLAKARAGAQGSTGPAGAAGAQGNSLYTWIAYANNSTGTSGFVNGANTGQTYIGIANNKTTATESTNPADYTWSRITGLDGVRGSDGADGQPTYTWFAYASNANGTQNFTNGESNSTHTFIGIAPNKSTPTESTNPADYVWTKIQGDAGPSPLNLVALDSKAVIDGKKVTGVGSDGWAGAVYSMEGFVGGAYATARVVRPEFMFGLAKEQNTASPNNYVTIDYAIYYQAGGTNGYRVYRNGALVSVINGITPAAGDILGVRYDNASVSYLVNGVEVFSHSAPAEETLFLNISLNWNSCELDSITFGPMGARGSQGPQGPTGGQGAQGPQGNFREVRYRRHFGPPPTPTGVNPANWTVAKPPFDGNPLWMSYVYKTGDGAALVGNWAAPSSVGEVGYGDFSADTVNGKGRLNIRDGNNNIRAAIEFSDVMQNTSQQWADVSGDGRPQDNADRTANNVAAGIANQGSFATRNNVQDGDFVGSLANRILPHPEDHNYLNAERMRYGGGISVANLRPSEAQANVTGNHVSAAFAGQGPWATANIPVAKVTTTRNNVFPYPFCPRQPRYPDQIGWNNAAANTHPELTRMDCQYGNFSHFNDAYCQRRPNGGPSTLAAYPYFDVDWQSGAPCSVSLNGYAGNATFYPYMEFLNGGRTPISNAPLNWNGNTERYEINGAAPPDGTAYVRVVVHTIYPASAGYQDTVFWGIKIEAGWYATPLTDSSHVKTFANYTEYETGASLEALRPSEWGSNVTGYHVAAGIAGQSALAANNSLSVAGVSSAVNLTVAGSGQRIADQRAMPPIASMNLGFKFTNPVSYIANGGNATISIGAGHALIGSTPIPYNGMSASVSGPAGSSRTFYLFVDENTNSAAWGGSKTLQVTTDGNAVYGSDNRVWFGSVRVNFPASGGGSGGGSSGGGGFGGGGGVGTEIP